MADSRTPSPPRDPRDEEPCTKVYVGDLGNYAREGDVEDAFSRFGKLKSVWVARRPPGFAFVMYMEPDDAKEAVTAMDGAEVCGRRVRCQLSHGKSRWPNGRPPTYLLSRPAPRYVNSPPRVRRSKSPPGFRRSPALQSDRSRSSSSSSRSRSPTPKRRHKRRHHRSSDRSSDRRKSRKENHSSRQKILPARDRTPPEEIYGRRDR